MKHYSALSMPRLGIKSVVWAVLFLLCTYKTTIGQPLCKLTIDDFQGAPRYNNQGTIAYTNCSINFKYHAFRERGYYRLNFDIQLTLNTDRSWLDKSRVTSPEMLAEVLNHEQGHYDIAWLEQQELKRTVSKTVFHEDYQRTAQNIFDRIDAKYKQLNSDYDADTQHMLNRVQQHSWDVYFKKKLEPTASSYK
jgi:hypothetical protein